jgi:hypothetical protein
MCLIDTLDCHSSICPLAILVDQFVVKLVFSLFFSHQKIFFFFFSSLTSEHSNTVGGGNSIRYCGSSCGVSTAPARLSPVCPAQSGDPIDSQVRWGISATTGNPYAQSGMGFTGEKNIDVPLNREWFCGRLTHFNHPISNAASSTKLGLQLNIPEFKVQQDFQFKLDIDETTNSVLSGPCPYPSTTPCSDKITFDLGGLDFTKKFKIGLVDYTLSSPASRSRARRPRSPPTASSRTRIARTTHSSSPASSPRARRRAPLAAPSSSWSRTA